jgi:hypothetical protein
MKRSATVLSLILLGALGASSCTKPEPVQFADLCAAGNDKKTVVTEGYLRARVSVFCSNIGGGDVTCGLDLFDPQGGEQKIGAHVRQGSGDNQIEKLPSGFKKEDVKIRDDGGALVGAGDRVRVTGRLSYAGNAETTVCFLNVDKIEKQ